MPTFASIEVYASLPVRGIEKTLMVGLWMTITYNALLDRRAGSDPLTEGATRRRAADRSAARTGCDADVALRSPGAPRAPCVARFEQAKSLGCPHGGCPPNVFDHSIRGPYRSSSSCRSRNSSEDRAPWRSSHLIELRSLARNGRPRGRAGAALPATAA